MGYAQDTCRLRAVSPTVQLVEYASTDGRRMALHGVHTCKSPCCPLCAPKWQRTRSDEIATAIEHHPAGADAVFFATLTMRHNRKMRLSLQHRLLTQAFGNLWSGNAGQKAAALLGGKPESIRAHDRTWSAQRGWHPHIHALLFVDDADLVGAELAALLDARWPKVLAAALRRFYRLCERILEKTGCNRPDCPVCYAQRQGPRRSVVFFGPWREHETPRVFRDAKLKPFPVPAGEQQGECPHFRERATRLFGVRMVPRLRRASNGVEVAVPLDDSIRVVFAMLADFVRIRVDADGDRVLDVSAILPNRAHGAFVERVRDAERLPKYLAKMGLELASTLDKLGSVGSDGITHYGLWEVARLACSHGNELRVPARRAWRELFFSTFGTQTITFSDRDALGLGVDPYADEQEPPEKASDETEQCIGQIAAIVFRERVAERAHGVLSELFGAYERGELGSLGYVESPGEFAGQALQRGPPEARGPPSTADPCSVNADGYLIERPERGLRGDVLPMSARIAEVEAGGSTLIGEAYRNAVALPSGTTAFPEQVRRRVRDSINGKD